MTTKPKVEEKLVGPEAPAETAPATPQAPIAPLRTRACVVKADFHVGRAVNGLVCSYHAMHYLPDGTRRAARS